MTIMNARQVHKAAMDDKVMEAADDQTNAWDPRAIVWIVVAVLAVVGVCLLFSWWFDFVGLSDKIAITAATVEAFK